MAAMMAGVFAVPVGIWFAGQTEISLAFIGAAVLFLPLFVFMPKVIQRGLKADVQAVIDTFGKNEQVKKKCSGPCLPPWPGWSWHGSSTREPPTRLYWP